MIQPASREDMKKQLDELLKDITKTVEDNRAALSLMARGLLNMFNPERHPYSGYNAEIFYILRQAVYQKNGYAYIERNLKKNLWDQFIKTNPDEIIKTSEAIRAATGLRMPEHHVARAVELRVKERVDHYTVKHAIMTHTDNLLEAIVKES